MNSVPFNYKVSFYSLFKIPVSREIEQLLVKQSSLEVYFEWLDSLIERKVCEVSIYAIASYIIARH